MQANYKVLLQNKIFNFPGFIFLFVGRNGVVDKATVYGLDGLGIESWWGENFPHPDLVDTRTLIQLVKRTFTGIKGPEGGVEYPSLSSTEDKERVELYLYAITEPLRLLLGRSFFTLFFICLRKMFSRCFDVGFFGTSDVDSVTSHLTAD
jgi:hypothetical protein